MTFSYVDLFAGIGGFHAALKAAGGKCVFASEINPQAAEIYEKNWGVKPAGDITKLANEKSMLIPDHDVLVGGFPCQPFSKSGHQNGMEDTRGTLFWNIAQIVKKRKPKIVLLENVRNLAGPRHQHEWQLIIKTLRDLGYRVDDKPLVVSPHELKISHGGRPQIRERIFIAATRGLNNKEFLPPEEFDLSFAQNIDPKSVWNLSRDLPIERRIGTKKKNEIGLTSEELIWLEAWEEFLHLMIENNLSRSISGFPLWVDSWVSINEFNPPRNTPNWKVVFLRKNSEFYSANKKILNGWLKNWNYLEDFPTSRRKFEWQAQDLNSIYKGLIQFRPSGIRVKKATYTPALVAMTQTSIYGPQKRRLTVRETARLQGFPEWFDFGNQPDSLSYKQLGNAVNVGVVYNVLKAQITRDQDLLGKNSKLVKTVLSKPNDPFKALKN